MEKMGSGFAYLLMEIKSWESAGLRKALNNVVEIYETK
jgi:hypothetical protein